MVKVRMGQNIYKTLSTYSFDQENARKDLESMIVLHEYPLSMVNHVGFKILQYPSTIV